METRVLDAKTLHAAFITACDFIITNREKLNAINVFPVADGDTGDNMSATALSVINLSSPKPTLKETFQSMANSALLGARGNSGMIFSQFFNGLTETSLHSEEINTSTFAELITKASISVRSAILHPVEGTIITVIDSWSQSITRLAREIPCFKQLIKQTLTEVYQTLQNTANTLAVLKEAQVVDAGALGFYHFISGFSDYLDNPREINKNHLHLECTDHHHEVPTNGAEPEERYCTEIMLAGEALNRMEIAQHLERFGDCVVSSGSASLSRFHIHCTKPADVFESLFDAGTITQAKAQDMLRQFQMIHKRKYPIALVTDSTADLPQSFLDEEQIHIIQLNMHLDQHHLLDRICVNPDTFYDNLSKLKTYPTTSFPSPSLIEEQMRYISNHYDHVIVLTLSQALSGTHDAIVKATESFANTHVINSCQTSGSLGFLVAHTAKLIAQGMNIDEIKKEVELKIPKVSIFVYVNQLESLIRCGRISKVGGMLAQLAHVKPIISISDQGKAILCDKAFSETKGLSKLISNVEVLRQKNELEAYAIVHAGVPEKAQEFAELTTEAFGQAPAFIEPASTAIGLHAGKGCIGLVTMMK